MTNSLIKVFVVALIGHLVLTLVLFLYGFDLSSMDSGVTSPISKQIAFRVAGLLMMPMSILWKGWMSKNLPNIVEWFLFIINSLLWGAVISSCFLKIVNRKQGNYAA
jgi:hypothetical protein